MECHELRTTEGAIIAWLQARPPHCDRGRWVAGIEAPIWRSESDPSPRYYFDLEAGKREVEAYLSAKKIDTQGAAWVARTYGAWR